MPLTLLGWWLVVSVIATSLLFVVPLRAIGGPRRTQAELEACKLGLQDIAARLKQGRIDEAEADAARLALLSRPRPMPWHSDLRLPGSPQTLAMSATVFVLVASVGALFTYGRQPAEVLGVNEPIASLAAHDEDLSNLKTYAGSIGSEHAASAPAPEKLLPDVTTMIDRLAARLEKEPDDIEGWRLLGWSYFHTERYQQSALAFGRAAELDPSSAELKQMHEDAKAKASGTANAAAPSPLQTGSVAVAAEGQNGHASPPSEAAVPKTDPAVLAMVDGLAARLETSPHDVDGWTRLMRSRVVLGQTDIATTAFRKALEVFKDDTNASGEIKAAALDLGLKSE